MFILCGFFLLFCLNLYFLKFLSSTSIKWQRDISVYECIGVSRHMQQYFSYICDSTDVQADWRSCTYGRAPNTIDIP